MTRRSARILLPALLLGAVTAVAGCDAASVEISTEGTGTTREPTPATSPEESAAASRTAEPPVASSSPAAPTSSAAAVATPPPPASVPPAAAPVDLLLPAPQLPGFNDEFFWTAGRTRASEPRELAGTCHKVPLTSIGALDVRHRSYEPPTGSVSTASELVAEFADPKTAWRAYQTLLAWHDSCAQRLGDYPRADVGAVQQVSVPRGSAGWFLLTYGPIGDEPDVMAHDAQGLALVGRRVVVLEMALYGPSYDYPAGQEPMVEAVRRAAARVA
ncbi:hypothetical protein [Nocardioides mesophilus]|uniref:Sensor domain-containing protein n=1 Tax=Nocardioides mesophilus TaxID=433659 RepID=A0A7G9RA10_9ACTN|nr:hypothetical protein [Nocardioides mesophilus]QNN52435.1 hypothetical protein H9L09_18475 [Nocardioides mesophilus]